MLYLWLKYIHIVSSTILFGTGLGTACVMWYGHYKKDVHAMAIINEYVVLVDWIFTGTSGIVQPVTGLWMVFIAGYSFTSLWVLGSIIGYLIAAACWIPVVFLQIKIRNLTVYAARSGLTLPQEYFFYFRWWFLLGWPAFISLLIVFYLMVMKPF
ncbi:MULTISPECIES: DUF2269 family protein [Legionella]|uniref:DUF2269 domain-containing protein n=1 Tax=Legionella septentrionalis TaxID=2498109 RepID=A0A3S0XEX9_9GAMM|nr:MULTISPECIES: DUF2269 domain-containing protein [Legionella]MCP0913231.1 DUF2269 domain-containing protein [Legionella sp. 27cVA30]RUQ79160.1 DUF2269 domain-containing protein [Legionella septentrionalis]RUR02393.1 DUF2269 domain-containing protein [Legionella septentrionalis]RUR10336.1 DUF2269 domain-containing protein [Legionella septentrionalis]